MRGILVSIILALVASTAAALSPPPRIMVFFSHGSTAITEHGDRAIKEVALVLRRNTNRRVLVMAHTDGAEAQSFSIDLSPARGEAVKRRLVECGVPADRIQVQVYGDSQDLVKVAPGTAEPQNRRVEFMIE